jgi:Protein of unknown function (DUF3383)
MPISFTKYVNILSGVLGSGAVRQRELILRAFSLNPLIPANTFSEWTNANDVESYFGSTSAEYAIAAKYFAFISKTITAPQKISFANWAQAALAPYLYGDPTETALLAAFNTISAAGTLKLSLGATTQQVSIGSLAAAGSLAAVAAIIQTAVRTVTADPDWASATVAYNASLRPSGGCFTITGGTTGAGEMACVAVASGTDVGVACGWQSPNAVVSQGSAAMTLTATMVASTAASNNFGTFAFIPTLNQTQDLELATWNSTQNVMFIFLLPVTQGTAAAISAALFNLPGCGMTLSPNTGDYPELFPGMILASTDYDQRNASQNYMFQVGNFEVSVSDDIDSDTYDGLRVNYYGETQEAGQIVEFYQRGTLTGLPTSPTDMNIYANEMWLKGNVATAFINLFLAVGQVSTNAAGRAQCIAVIQNAITQALKNGTISVGSVLNNTQILAINSITGTTTAWQQVQTIGYWLDVTFSSYVTEDSRTEWEVNYTLVYKKNDAVRSVQGRHVLI